jgi:hypothetical protein
LFLAQVLSVHALPPYQAVDVQVVVARVFEAQEVPVRPLPVSGKPIQVPPGQAERSSVV